MPVFYFYTISNLQHTDFTRPRPNSIGLRPVLQQDQSLRPHHCTPESHFICRVASCNITKTLTRQIRRPAHLPGRCQASTHLCTSLCLQQAKPANTCLQRDSDKHITNMQEGALYICRGAALRDTATARCSFFREPGNIARHRHPRCSIRPCWPLLNHGCKQ